ncbi:hypothetical protein K8I31_03900 [bacterium]|nr:hypothetical protein [bacterium]
MDSWCSRLSDRDLPAMRGGTLSLVEYMYDLSNGVTSGGDIIRVGP